MSQEEMQQQVENMEEAAAKTEEMPDEENGGQVEAAEEAKEETAAASENEETASEEEAAEEETSESGEAAESEEKSGFFKKKKDKKDKKDLQIEELTDKMRRTMAEFENFRKRNEREKSHMYEVGAREVIEKILPVMDNFERGLAVIPEEEKEGAVAQGMEMIYKQLLTVFEQIGVTPIEAVGKEFDPNIHNAVMHVEDEQAGENIVVEEFQKGYMYRESVVRHSMVKVAN